MDQCTLHLCSTSYIGYQFASAFNSRCWLMTYKTLYGMGLSYLRDPLLSSFLYATLNQGHKMPRSALCGQVITPKRIIIETMSFCIAHL